MRNIIKMAIFTMIAILFTGACSSTPGPNSQLQSLVPDQTVVWIQSGNLNEFIDRAEALIAAAELDDLMKGKSLRDLIFESAGFDFPAIIDLNQPLGFGLLKIDKQLTKNFYFTATIKNEDKIKELLQDNEKVYWKITKNIVELSTHPFDQLTFKRHFHLDLADGYEASSLSYVIDFQSLKENDEFNIDSAFETMDGLVRLGLMNNSENLGFFTLLYEGFRNLTNDLITETKWVSGSIGINELGMYTKGDIQFTSGGNISQLLNSLKGLGKIKSLMKYLPQRSFVSTAISINNSALQEKLMDLSLALIEETIENDETLKEYEANLRKMADALGTQEAFGMQLDVDFQKLIFLSQSLDQGSYDAFADVFNLQGFMAYDLKKDILFSDLLEENIELSNTLINSSQINPSLGDLGITMKVYLDKNREIDGFVFDEMGFIVESEYEENDMSLLFQKIFEKLRFYYHQEGKKLYAFVGPGNIEALKAYVANDGLKEKAFDQTAFYQKFQEVYPEDYDIFFQFSFSNMFGNLFTNNELSESSGSPGILGGITYDQKSLSSFTLISKEELATLVYLGNLFQAFATPSLENAFGDT
ncbi:MAG: hypothetical protein JXR70_06855 [Spirochaetales bacterium]|nr:hypothetical protein [Spirochaetales bacterium]